MNVVPPAGGGAANGPRGQVDDAAAVRPDAISLDEIARMNGADLRLEYESRCQEPTLTDDDAIREWLCSHPRATSQYGPGATLPSCFSFLSERGRALSTAMAACLISPTHAAFLTLAYIAFITLTTVSPWSDANASSAPSLHSNRAIVTCTGFADACSGRTNAADWPPWQQLLTRNTPVWTPLATIWIVALTQVIFQSLGYLLNSASLLPQLARGLCGVFHRLWSDTCCLSARLARWTKRRRSSKPVSTLPTSKGKDSISPTGTPAHASNGSNDKQDAAPFQNADRGSRNANNEGSDFRNATIGGSITINNGDTTHVHHHHGKPDGNGNPNYGAGAGGGGGYGRSNNNNSLGAKGGGKNSSPAAIPAVPSAAPTTNGAAPTLTKSQKRRQKRKEGKAKKAAAAAAALNAAPPARGAAAASLPATEQPPASETPTARRAPAEPNAGAAAVAAAIQRAAANSSRRPAAAQPAAAAAANGRSPNLDLPVTLGQLHAIMSLRSALGWTAPAPQAPQQLVIPTPPALAEAGAANSAATTDAPAGTARAPAAAATPMAAPGTANTQPTTGVAQPHGNAGTGLTTPARAHRGEPETDEDARDGDYIPGETSPDVSPGSLDSIASGDAAVVRGGTEADSAIPATEVWNFLRMAARNGTLGNITRLLPGGGRFANAVNDVVGATSRNLFEETEGRGSGGTNTAARQTRAMGFMPRGGNGTSGNRDEGPK